MTVKPKQDFGGGDEAKEREARLAQELQRLLSCPLLQPLMASAVEMSDTSDDAFAWLDEKGRAGQGPQPAPEREPPAPQDEAPESEEGYERALAEGLDREPAASPHPEQPDKEPT